MAFRFKHSLILFAGLIATGASAQTANLAIVGAHIETGDGKTYEKGTILIANGKILAVGDNIQVPPESPMIDGTGIYVYPGFIDAYSTQGLKLPSPPSAGTPPDTRNTAPATMWHANKRGIRADIVAANCLDLADRLKDSYAQGVTTALITSGSGSIRGIGSVVDYVEKGHVLLKNAAAEIALRGGGGGFGGGYPGTLFGVTALTRQVLIDAQAYAANPDAKKDAGMENLKLLVTGQVPALLIADSSRELSRIERLADEFGFRFIVEGGREAYRDLEPLKTKQVPVILSLDVADAPSKKAETGDDATPQEVLNERYDTWLERSHNPKILNDAGLPLAFSLGGGFAEYLPGVRKMIAQGLPRDAALTAMTLGAAKILRVDDQVGSIAPGKLANLVLMTGDFAAEKSAVKSVVIEGVLVDPSKKGASK